MLTVSEITGGYGGSRVLEGVSLTVGRSEVVALLGPNGHGKTTLLRTISGLNRAYGGTVIFDGVDISSMQPERIAVLGLTHIPQGDLTFAQMTVLENLLMGAYPRRAWSQRSQRLEVVFSLFPRLAERQDQIAQSLSGGERRMLALGRGLMADARLLMIDEPALGLAPVLTGQVYEQIRQIAETGVSILIVDESANHVSELAHRMYVMEAGSIVLGGRTDEVLANETLLAAYLG